MTDMRSVHTELFSADEIREGARRAGVVRHEGHPVRAFRERHPTLGRCVSFMLFAAVVAVLAGAQIAHVAV